LLRLPALPYAEWMLNYLKRFYVAARNKVTTYVGMAIAALATLAARAEDLLNSVPQLKALLPAGPILSMFIAKWVLPSLGVLVVFTRVRRLLHPPAT